jgi:RNA polymerase sigma factor for flagellar operon FliA
MKLEPKTRKRISHEETLALWKKYRETNDPQLRNRIVLTFAPLVKYIVYNKIRELPARCEVDDFISCGLEALINSIDRYDPEKGATLEQYAWTRIHGAVLDELRRQDWAPRSLRRWERDIANASASPRTTAASRRSRSWPRRWALRPTSFARARARSTPPT